jgi:hypothetical protein
MTYGISLVPDTTGTRVEVVGETVDASLPSRLDLDLVVRDDAALTQGGPATGQPLRYSDVQDGLGNIMPADQVRAGKLRGVATDGRRLRLSYHVSIAGSTRVVYPIPSSPDLAWARAQVYVQRSTLTCWADAPSGDSAFGPCEQSQGEVIDGTRHAAVRLVVRPATAAG